MIMFRSIVFMLILGIAFSAGDTYAAEPDSGVRVKELSRVKGVRDNALVGYGIVSGLAGTGDSLRSEATFQSISNLLQSFGVNVLPNQIQSRNAAAVMVAAKLPAFSQPGDELDVNVTSIGDARSLVGGTLLLTHLSGPDGKIYALAQGPVSVGGFKYDLNGNVVQKNHPTAAHIPSGAHVERATNTQLTDDQGQLQYILFNPDFTTANRIVESMNASFNDSVAHAIDAGRVAVKVPESYQSNLVSFLTKAENLLVEPDRRAKVVINERTGTVISGGDVRLSQVSITHGDLKVSINTEYIVSQPVFVRETGSDVRTQVVPDTTIEVTEVEPISVSMPNNTSVTDLVAALNKVKASSRDIITILQGVKRAGALHAELIIQ